MLETTEMQALSSAQARLLVVELSLAALIAQLPPQSLEEVTCLLCFVADSTEQAEDLEPGQSGEASLGHVGFWAAAMLERVMNSRKASRVNTEAASI